MMDCGNFKIARFQLVVEATKREPCIIIRRLWSMQPDCYPMLIFPFEFHLMPVCVEYFFLVFIQFPFRYPICRVVLARLACPVLPGIFYERFFCCFSCFCSLPTVKNCCCHFYWKPARRYRYKDTSGQTHRYRYNGELISFAAPICVHNSIPYLFVCDGRRHTLQSN